MEYCERISISADVRFVGFSDFSSNNIFIFSILFASDSIKVLSKLRSLAISVTKLVRKLLIMSLLRIDFFLVLKACANFLMYKELISDRVIVDPGEIKSYVAVKIIPS